MSLNFKQAYKGFIESEGKRPKVKYKDPLNHISYENAIKCKSYMGVLNDNIILIDIDNKEMGKRLILILDALDIKCPILETDKGYHFLFSDSTYIEKTRTKATNPIGLEYDSKTGNNHGLELLKNKGVERRIVNDVGVIPPLPFFLSTRVVFKALKDLYYTGGVDSRNSILSKHKYGLLKNKFSYQETVEICTIVNNFIFYEPLDQKELDTVLRLENSININNDNLEIDFDNLNDQEITPNMFHNERGKLIRPLLVDYLKWKFKIVMINNLLYIYTKDNVYRYDEKLIETEIHKMSNCLLHNQRKEVIKVLKLEVEKVEVSKDWVNFKNGLFNYKTKEFREHTSEIITINKIPHNLKLDAPTDKTLKIINSFVCNDKDLLNLLFEVVGYTFYSTAKFKQRATVIIGPKDNGKSVFTDYLEFIFDTINVSFIEAKDFTDKFTPYKLINIMLNIGTELTDGHIVESDIFKRIIAGDTIIIQQKGKDPLFYAPQAKHIFCANDFATFRDTTGAVSKRLQFLPFKNNFSIGSPFRDEQIYEKLRDVEVVEGFIRLAIEGLERLEKQGNFTNTPETRRLQQEFENANNPLLIFIDEVKDDFYNGITQYGLSTCMSENIKNDYENWYLYYPIPEIYDCYRYWARDNGYGVPNKNNFSKNFRNTLKDIEIKQKKYKGKKIQVFFNVKKVQAVQPSTT